MFEYRNNNMYLEDVCLVDVLKKHQSPCYIYSKKIIENNVNKLKSVFEGVDIIFAFAAKVESNIAILKILADNGFGCDIVSAGELKRYIKAGGDSSKVMFSGVSKSEAEIEFAIQTGIYMFNIESIPEAKRIDTIAKRLDKTVKCAIRVNPDIEAGTLDKITTGKKGNKFGISVDTIKDNIELFKSLNNIAIEALAMHIGSQILKAEPFYEAIKVMKQLKEDMTALGFSIDTIDLGGGIGIQYDKTQPAFDFEAYSQKVIPLLKSMEGTRFVLEPGRFITGNAAALIMKVEYIKEEWGKTFLLTNAGMNDYIRCAMYDAYNDILPLVKHDGEMKVDIVGPICESSDYFAKDRTISTTSEGEFLALLDAGGYGASMSSNYNTRELIEQILIDGSEYKLIRKKQTFDSMIENELL